jgi:hypothetical protein
MNADLLMASHSGIWADMSRTVARGNPSQALSDMCEAVLDAQREDHRNGGGQFVWFAGSGFSVFRYSKHGVEGARLGY